MLCLRLVRQDIKDVLRYPVGLVERYIKHTGHILDHGLCLQGSECGYLTYPVHPVMFGDIVDDALSALVAEVNVKIRQ